MTRAVSRTLIVLLAAGLTLAVAENVRPWRQLQVEHFELELRRLREALAASRERVESEAADLEQALAAEEGRLAERYNDVRELEADLGGFRAKLHEVQRRRAELRAEADAVSYRLRRLPEADAIERGALSNRHEALRQELLEQRAASEELERAAAVRERRLADLRSGVVEARAARDGALSEVERLERRLGAVGRGSFLRGVPVLGLFHPSVAVREVSLPAPGVPGVAVDRCATCHLAAVRRESAREDLPNDDWPAVFRRHPRPELFVDPDSPHPYRSFGCTACHRGSGRATGFSSAGHLPMTGEQEAAWTERWRFDRRRLPPRPILSGRLAEASCSRCHGRRAPIAQAPVHTAGRELVRALGCAGCHANDPAAGGPGHRGAGGRRTGPALTGIATKTTPAWAFHWLAAPRDFRPTTWMPHFFDLDDERTMAGGGGRERQVAEIRALVSYLWEHSRPPSPAFEAVPQEQGAPGDSESGRTLFHSIGCSRCHLLDPTADRSSFLPRLARLHGPNLARTGSKVSAPWLEAWLRDPSSYHAGTSMPNLRLSPGEAADLTAFLMTRRDAAWEGLELPPAPKEIRDDLVLSYLRQTNTIEDSEARYREMGERQKNVYLGHQTIARLGCHGCHEIPGFDDAPPPASDLSDFGTRPLPGLGFGHLAELADIYPGARPGVRPAAARLLDYRLSPPEAEAVLVNLLGRVPPKRSGRDRVDAASRANEPRPTDSEIIERYACRACHVVGDSTRSQPQEGEDEMPAPDLTMAGARVRSDWLYAYLENPGRFVLRPWLGTRMPTFPFDEDELDVLVRGFASATGQRIFVSTPPAAEKLDVAVGEAVFGMLQCGRCHPDADAELAGGVEVPEFAPPYRFARTRLRPRWVVEWILDPRRFSPGTRMPVSFPPARAGAPPDSSFLAGNIATPMFRAQHDRLLRIFDSQEALDAYLGDAERVAEALRAYLWSLEG